MELIKPKALKKGDLIGLITPSSTPNDLTRVEKSVNYFEKLGYNVIVGKNVGKRNSYLAGSDEERIYDIESMFSNREVKGIFCLRGGYGTARLLPHINYDLIKNNPKVFVGYSDISALQMAILSKTGLVTFAGPMPAVDFYENPSEFTEQNFWEMVTDKRDVITLNTAHEIKSVTNFKAEGNLLGGNLIVWASILGTEYMPSLNNSVLFLEEIEEAPYRIDRIFAHLKMLKEFNQIKGLVFGQFEDCVDSDENNKITIDELIEHYFGNLKIPILKNISFGHIKNFITVPYGVKVKIDSEKCEIVISENVVS